MTSAKKSVFKRIVVIIIAVLIFFSAISMVATKIVYDNIFERYDTKIEIPATLSDIVNGREKKEYYSGQNMLTGYLYRADINNSQNGLIIIAPGFHAGTDNYLWQIKSLLDYGWSVFVFDTTGSCESEGESSVGFAQILPDMEATIKYVEKNNRFGYNDIVLLGHSRGGYAACCALEYDYDIAAVISVSGINSAMEGVIGSAVDYVGPLAYGNYGFLWMYQAMLFGSKTLNTNADEAISNSDVPVLIIHGENDTEVPLDEFSIISHSDEITSKKVEYLICSEPYQNGHTDLLFNKDGTANDKLMAEINDFLIKNIN
ncbi:MAG: alpha/beta fold hydrolase [Acutalibacteraceae bacterium]|nr:alpha/beta fold hydrolase [Acutalibacteraceae bacterium]